MINQQKKSDATLWAAAIQLFAQVSGWIVLPIISALFLGRWLDERYDKEPMFLLSCLAIAFVLTNVGLVKQTLSAMKKMDKESENKKKD